MIHIDPSVVWATVLGCAIWSCMSVVLAVSFGFLQALLDR